MQDKSEYTKQTAVLSVKKTNNTVDDAVCSINELNKKCRKCIQFTLGRKPLQREVFIGVYGLLTAYQNGIRFFTASHCVVNRLCTYMSIVVFTEACPNSTLIVFISTLSSISLVAKV